jgi:hypothetical protein
MKQYIVVIPSGFDNAKEVVEFTNNSQYQSIDEAIVNIITNLTSEEVVEEDVLTFTLEEFVNDVNSGAIDNLTDSFIANITIVDSLFNEIENAKNFLKDKGFYTDNLWSIHDVRSKFECTEEEAQYVIDKSLTNEATMEQIWLSIGIFGDMENLTPIEEEQE